MPVPREQVENKSNTDMLRNYVLHNLYAPSEKENGAWLHTVQASLCAAFNAGI